MESNRTYSLRARLILSAAAVLPALAFAHPEDASPTAAPEIKIEAKLYEISKFRRLDLAGLRGKNAIITFFQPDCAPCRDQLKALRCLKEANPGAEIVAVGIGDTLLLKKEIAPLRLNFPVVESTGRFQESIGGVPSTPYTLLVGKDGSVDAKESGAKTCDEWKKTVSAKL